MSVLFGLVLRKTVILCSNIKYTLQEVYLMYRQTDYKSNYKHRKSKFRLAYKFESIFRER